MLNGLMITCVMNLQQSMLVCVAIRGVKQNNSHLEISPDFENVTVGKGRVHTVR